MSVDYTTEPPPYKTVSLQRILDVWGNIPAIYAITNTLNGKRYVGSTKDFKRRIQQHLCLLRSNRHFNVHLQRAWNKYGEDVFRFDVVEMCVGKNLFHREQLWIDHCGYYNVSPIAGAPIGRYASELKVVHASKIITDGRKRIAEANRKRVWTKESIKKSVSARMETYKKRRREAVDAALKILRKQIKDHFGLG